MVRAPSLNRNYCLRFTAAWSKCRKCKWKFVLEARNNHGLSSLIFLLLCVPCTILRMDLTLSEPKRESYDLQAILFKWNRSNRSKIYTGLGRRNCFNVKCGPHGFSSVPSTIYNGTPCRLWSLWQRRNYEAFRVTVPLRESDLFGAG